MRGVQHKMTLDYSKEVIPKVNFLIPPVNVTSQNIAPFLSDTKNWDWSSTFYKKYPGFKTKRTEFKTYNEFVNALELFLTKFYKENKEIITKKKNELQNGWGEINNKIMNVLSDIVETNWKQKEFFCGVSLNPYNPRWIEHNSFDCFYRDDLKEMKETCIHELLHFIYFKKWQEVFPKTNPKEYNEPHLIWKLSEMVPKIILNDERIQIVFKNKFGSYDEFEKMKINRKPILEYLQEFYDSKENFEDFLKKSWKFVKLHEKEINIK
jgi:hypothetical protein